MAQHPERRHPGQRIGDGARTRAGTDPGRGPGGAHHQRRLAAEARDREIGSIEAGKLADFVVLNTDPYEVDPSRLQETMEVLGTWVSGCRVDLNGFMASVREVAHRFDSALLAGSQPHQC